jgi:hypothetical protein
MSEEQLKQLNTRLLEAERLLNEVDELILAFNIMFNSESVWHEDYQKYLKTYKK